MSSNSRFSDRAKDLGFTEESISSPQFQKRYQKLQEKQEIPNFESEDLDKGIEQSIASLGSHAMGQIAALPGNITELAYSASDEAKRIRKKFYDTLGMSWAEEGLSEFEHSLSKKESEVFDKSDKLSTDQDFDQIQPAVNISAPFKFLKDKLPNSQDVNKFIDESFGGYFAPKSETQKLANDVAGDIVNSFLNRSPRGIYRNFVVPSLSNAVKKGMDLYGVPESKSQIGKMITYLGLDMAGVSNARQYIGNQFRVNARRIPRNEIMNARPRDAEYLRLLRQDLESGGTSPSTQAALQKIQELEDAMLTGHVNVREVHDAYRKINELKSNYGAFNVEGAAKPGHVHNLNRVQRLTRNMLQRYGRNRNPDFLRNFNENNAAWSTLESSDAIAGYVKKNYNKPFVSEAARALFSKPLGIPAAVGLTALERAQAFLQRLSNPTLRNYYGNVLKYSLNNNRVGMVQNLEKLDKALKKEEG